jgi:hypothetical protein
MAKQVEGDGSPASFRSDLEWVQWAEDFTNYMIRNERGEVIPLCTKCVVPGVV